MDDEDDKEDANDEKMMDDEKIITLAKGENVSTSPSSYLALSFSLSPSGALMALKVSRESHHYAPSFSLSHSALS